MVVNAAGCGSAMKEYGDLLQTAEARAFSEKVRDVTELLASVTPRAPRGPVPLRVAYHDACHLAHAQGVRRAPRELLRAIPELELVEVGTEAQLCCGSAGIYNLVQPEAAAELGARKARHLIDTGAQAIAAGNPGVRRPARRAPARAGLSAAHPPSGGARQPLHHRGTRRDRSTSPVRVGAGAAVGLLMTLALAACGTQASTSTTASATPAPTATNPDPTGTGADAAGTGTGATASSQTTTATTGTRDPGGTGTMATATTG